MAKFGIDMKNTRQMVILGAVICLGALYIYVKFLLVPQISGVARICAKVNKATLDVKGSERQIAEIDGLKKQVAQYRDKIESYERMLPVEQEIPKLLEDLSEMAKRSDVKILGITPLPTKQESGLPEQIYQDIPILINAKSGYHELGKFISDLENSDRFMKVVDIKVIANRSTPKKHDVELLVLTYTLSENR